MPDSSETRPTSLRLVLLFFAIIPYILSQNLAVVNNFRGCFWFEFKIALSNIILVGFGAKNAGFGLKILIYY